MTGRFIDAARDFRSGAFRLTFSTTEPPEPEVLDEWLAADLLDVKVTKHREKRSRDANAYFWTLCGKLAAVLGRSPREVYREAVRDIGDNYDVVCVRDRAVEKLREAWEARGLGWITDTTGSKLAGCQNVILYYGSSTYDKAQMKRLIDVIVAECKEQGIETATPAEQALLLEKWEEK